MARRSPTASAAGLPGKSYRRSEGLCASQHARPLTRLGRVPHVCNTGKTGGPQRGRKATLAAKGAEWPQERTPLPRGVYAPAVSLKPLGSRERYICYLQTFNPLLLASLARGPARIDSSRGWAPSSRVRGTAADALGRGEDEPMPRLGPPQSGLHCWQSEREDQVASRRVASFAQYGRPFPGFADDFTRSRDGEPGSSEQTLSRASRKAGNAQCPAHRGETRSESAGRSR